MAEIHPVQMNKSSISATGVGVRFANAVILEGVDLEVREGEFVVIVGPSGSGKTTLLNALAGFVGYTGKVLVPGRVGVVFQDHAVFPWMTVEENIGFGVRELAPDRREEVVREHLRMVGLEHRAELYPAQLSGGQIQRVGIARALAPDPEVVFMDEPYASLDRYTRELMQKWLLEIWGRRHPTIVFITHDMEEAVFLADRVLVIGQKRICAEYVVPFERPRHEDLKHLPEFLALQNEILRVVTVRASEDTGTNT